MYRLIAIALVFVAACGSDGSGGGSDAVGGDGVVLGVQPLTNCSDFMCPPDPDMDGPQANGLLYPDELDVSLCDNGSERSVGRPLLHLASGQYVNGCALVRCSDTGGIELLDTHACNPGDACLVSSHECWAPAPSQ